MRLGLTALAVEPLAIGGDAAAGLETVVAFYWSDRGYVTGPGETPANQNFKPRALSPLIVERMLPLTPDAPRRAGLAAGEIALANTDGALDALPQAFAIDGRRVVVRVGQPGFAYAGFVTLFDGTASGWRLADDLTIRIALQDLSYRLDVPIQGTLYSGAGGLGGTAEIKGNPKPLLYGETLNLPAVLVDPTALIYQVHDGAMSAVTAVYDRGSALTFEADVADITATTVTAGFYKTQLSGGYIRLGSTPAGLVTADAKGDSSGGYIDKTGAIAKRIMESRGGLAAGEIDAATFTALDAAQAAVVGLWIGPEARTIAEALDELLAGIAGWWGASRLGKMQVGRVTAPQAGDSVLTLTEAEIVEIQRLQPPASIEPPNYRRRVGYQRLGIVQATDLAAGVTAARRQFLAEDQRLGIASDVAVQIDYRQATDPPPAPGTMAAQAAADTEAARLLALFKVPRGLFRVTVKALGYSLEVGRTITLKYPRHGLDNGKPAYVLGQAIDAERNETALTVFV